MYNKIANGPFEYHDKTSIDNLCMNLWIRNDDCEIVVQENGKIVDVFHRWTYDENSDEWFDIGWLQCNHFDIDIQYDENWIPYVATLTRRPPNR